MQNRKERRQLLKKLGLLNLDKKKDPLKRIEDGKEKHRLNLQEMKNSEIKKNREKGIEPQENEFFMYRNLDNSYDNLQSFLLKKDWNDTEK
jgi:hypothetical protein